MTSQEEATVCAKSKAENRINLGNKIEIQILLWTRTPPRDGLKRYRGLDCGRRSVLYLEFTAKARWESNSYIEISCMYPWPYWSEDRQAQNILMSHEFIYDMLRKHCLFSYCFSSLKSSLNTVNFDSYSAFYSRSFLFFSRQNVFMS